MAGVDRRRFPRVQVADMSAVLLARLHSAVCTVVDLSTGGARFGGQLPLTTGETLSATFEVQRIPVTVNAIVVRVERDAVAVAFRDLSPAMHHFLHRLVLDLSRRA